jgi:anthranilate synthase component 1
MNLSDLSQLAAQGYNRVAVTRRVLADLDTPLSAYLKLAAAPYSYLLESVEGGEKWGRYSIIGLPAQTILKVVDKQITVSAAGVVTERIAADDPYDFIRSFLARFKVPADDTMARFAGGLVGYFGYDTVRYVEHRVAASTPPDSVNTPDIVLMVSEAVVVFDNLRCRMTLVVFEDPAYMDAYGQAQR